METKISYDQMRLCKKGLVQALGYGILKTFYLAILSIIERWDEEVLWETAAELVVVRESPTKLAVNTGIAQLSDIQGQWIIIGG